MFNEKEKILTNKDVFDRIAVLCVKLHREIGSVTAQEFFDQSLQSIEKELTEILTDFKQYGKDDKKYAEQ